MKQLQGVASQAALLLVGTTGLNVANFALHVIGARRLGPQGYGVFAAVLGLVNVVSVLAAVAQLVIARYAAEAAGDERRLATIVVTALRWALRAGLVLALAIAVAAPAIAAVLRLPEPWTVVLGAVTVGLTIVLTAGRAVFQGVQRFGTLSGSLLVEAATKVGLALAVTAVRATPTALFVAIVAASACSLGVVWKPLARLTRGAASGVAVDASSLPRATLAAASAIGVFTLLGFVDVLVVKHFYDPEQAGAYSALSICGKIMLFAVNFVPYMVVPRAAANRTQGRESRAPLVVAIVTALVVSVPLLAACVLVPAQILTAIAGARYAGVAPFLAEYCAAMALLGIANVVMQFRTAADRLGFALPVLAVASLEVVALFVAHATIRGIVNVLALGQLVLVVTALWGVFARFPRSAQSLRGAS